MAVAVATGARAANDDRDDFEMSLGLPARAGLGAPNPKDYGNERIVRESGARDWEALKAKTPGR
jgi:hypothetical protein